MKWLNIFGIISAVGILPAVAYYIEQVNKARWSNIFLSEGGFGDYVSPGPSAADVTLEAGVVMFLFASFFVAVNVMNLIKIKTTTTKILAIIGLSLIGIAFIWNLLLLSTPTHISFDEGGQIWLIAGLMMLAFSIVFLVQTNRYTADRVNDEILDDEII